MMKNIKKNSIKSVFQKTLLILFLLITIILSSSFVRADDTQEKLVVNGTEITYRGGGYVYINKEHSSEGGEFRGVWVSPLTGDIGMYISKESYQSQMLDVIKNMEKYNLNVMIFHVRIMNDALYESKYNSWSSYYNTNPDWDMLPWLIEECHKHGIEFHAWMNPYRVTTKVSLSLEECAKNYKSTNAASNPANLLKASTTIILNPGIPEVQEFLVNTCMELVENYDVDAIHFDDYFYAAGIDDSDTIKRYNTTGLSEADFRRAQVDAFIEKLSKELRAYNQLSGRRVQLGIAPTGVWSNGNGAVSYDSEGHAISSGSRTSAYAHYGSPLYADTLKWINNNWIDYILPQTYWAITNGAGPYCDLVKWWNAACKYSKTNLYSSLGLYMSSGGNASWSTNHYETYQQIMYANTLDIVKGSSIYNYTSYVGATTNPDKAFRDVNKIWNKAAYLPEIRTMDPIIPGEINNLKLEKNDYGLTISFDKVSDAKFYCIYRSTSPVTFDSEEIIDVIGSVGKENRIIYTDYNALDNTTYYYGVKAQSNSLSLGLGSTISSSDSQVGDNPNIGEITGVEINGTPIENNEMTIKFDELVYPFGGKVNYNVTASFYQDGIKSSGVSAKITTKNSGYVASFDVPDGVDSVEVKIVAKNKCGESTNISNYNVYKNLGAITNFVITDTSTYNGGSAKFIWNNLNKDNTIYTIEYSFDEFDYKPLEVLSENMRDFNIRYNGNLYDPQLNNAKRVYYRIKAENNGGIGYSNVVSIFQYNYLGAIEGLKVNDNRKLREVDVEEGDTLTLSWKDSNSDAIYTVLVSFDQENWMGIGGYNKAAVTNISSGEYKATIPINYTHFLFYLKIEATLAGAKSESDVITVNVTLDEVYSDDAAKFLYDYYSMFVNKMDIFK